MKKVLSVVLVILLALSSLFLLTGCENKPKTVEISYAYSDAITVKASVPVVKQDDGQEVAAYNFTKDKPEKALTTGTFYLVTDKAVFTFYTRGLVYNTGVKYKEKHGDVDASFQGYLEFVNDPESGVSLKNMERIKIGDRDALKFDYREGVGSGELYGYNYLIALDDLMPGSVFEMVVSPIEGKDGDISTVMADQTVIDIINSIVLTSPEPPVKG